MRTQSTSGATTSRTSAKRAPIRGRIRRRIAPAGAPSNFSSNSSRTSEWTNTRSAQVQTWPLFVIRAVRTFSTALSISASFQTMAGALPLSSSEISVRFTPAARMIDVPVSTLPVIEITSMVEDSTSAAPVSSAPATRLQTPSGRSISSSMSSNRRSVDSGVNSLGLTTMSIGPMRGEQNAAGDIVAAPKGHPNLQYGLQ